MRGRHGHSLRARRRWLVALALVGIVLVHGFLIARLLLSPEQFRLRTRALLQQHWAGPVSVGEAAYEFPLGFRLGALGLDRAKEQGGERFFEAKALGLKCGLLAALRGKLEVEELVLEEPELTLRAADLRGMKIKGGEAPKARVGRVVLRGGRIRVGEGVLFEGSPAQELRALSVELTRTLRLADGYAFEGEAESDLWGRCTLRGTVDLAAKRFEADVAARRIAIGPRLRALLPPKAIEALDRYRFRGSVNVTVKPSVTWAGEKPQWELAASAELLDCTAAYDRFPLPCTELRGEVAYDGTNVTYRNIRGRAGAATITLAGSTTREKVELDFAAYGRPLDPELFEAAHPPLKRLWTRCGIQGGVIDVEAHSVWNRQARMFEATVTTRVREGKATHLSFPYPLSDITGVLVWRGTGSEEIGSAKEPGVTQIRGLRGAHGSARVELNGEARDDGVLDITIKGYEMPLDKALYDALQEPWKKTYDLFRPTGTAAVECRITGPTVAPQKPQYRLSIRPEGVAFRHVKFPHVIEDVRGEIRIDENGRVTLHDLTGRIGDIPLKFLGIVTPGPKGPASDITVAAPEVELGPPVRALLTEAWGRVYDPLAPQGTVAFTWKLAEDPAAGLSRQSCAIECVRQCSIQARQFPLRLTGLLGRVDVDGTGQTIFTGMKGRLGEALIEVVDGGYVPGPDQGLRFTLKGSGLAFNDALRGALPEAWRKVWDEVQPRGEADIEYHFADNPKDAAHPVQRVSIEPRNASVTCRKFPLPVTEIARGKVTFDHDGNATISNLQGKARERAVQVTGKVTSGSPQSLVHLEVSARKLPIDAELRQALPKEWQAAWDTFQPGGAADVEAVVEGDVQKGDWKLVSLRAVLEAGRATYAKLPIPLTDLRGRIEVEGGVATLTDLVGRSPAADQVRLEGRLATDGAAASRLLLRAQNLRLTPELLAALPEEVGKALRESEIKGAADMDVTLTLPAKGGSEPAGFFGTVGLRACSFRRGHPVEQLDGDVQIAKGVVTPQGGVEVDGTLNLRQLIVRGLAASGVQGQFAYAVQRSEGAPPRPVLTLTGVQGSFYGGRLSVPKAELDLAQGAVATASLLLTAVDFKEFCKEGLKYGKNVSGVFDLKIEVPAGTLKEEGLTGDGVARVDHGNLGELPVASAVFDVLRFQLPERAITKGELRFGLARDHLTVERISLGREGWLMTGWGTVGYDETLALKFITPKSGSILDVPRLIAGTLIEIDLGGTLSQPQTGQTLVPVSRVYEEFRKLLNVW